MKGCGCCISSAPEYWDAFLSLFFSCKDLKLLMTYLLGSASIIGVGWKTMVLITEIQWNKSPPLFFHYTSIFTFTGRAWTQLLFRHHVAFRCCLVFIPGIHLEWTAELSFYCFFLLLPIYYNSRVLRIFQTMKWCCPLIEPPVFL